MIKIAALSLIAAVSVTASSAFAADMTCCASKTGKMECSQIYAKLNLTPEQKTSLDTFQQRCEKDGCTEGSMQKFLASAKGVLSADQYAQLKSECKGMEKQAEKSGS